VAKAAHSLNSVRDMLGLSATTVSRLVDAGFVTPQRGPRNEYRFSFQDVVLLRTAHRLQAAKIPPRRIVKALASLREQLPEQLPLTGLRISAVGSDVAVHEGGVLWDAESRQMLLDFEVAPSGGTVALIARELDTGPAAAPARPAATSSAGAQLAQARALEASDPAAAERAYREAIEQAADSPDAYLNLGALLYEAGRIDEALRIYDQGLAQAPQEPRLHYNRALALEDLQRDDEALAAYEACLKLMPDFADAHFNAARLCEQLGKGQLALRHFSAYRRLQR
jgi:tetratricopeptide (TPR) repeat protein